MKPTTDTSKFPIAYRARILAHARSQRAAAVSRRRAAARRLAWLILAMLAITAGSWLAVVQAGVPIIAGIIPTVAAVVLIAMAISSRRRVFALNAADRRMIRRIDEELRALSRGETVEHSVSDELIGGRTRTLPSSRHHDSSDDDASQPAAGAETSQANTSHARGAARSTAAAAPKRALASLRSSVASKPKGPNGPDGPGGGGKPEEQTPAARNDDWYDVEAEFTDDEWAAEPGAPIRVPDEVVAEADDDAYGDQPDVQPAEEQSTAGPTWTPAPVPAPSWALRPEVPRRHTATWQPVEEAPSASVPMRPGMADARFTYTGDSVHAEELAEQEHVVDLDEILARRRGA